MRTLLVFVLLAQASADLEAALASSYSSCYDPSGVNCTCTGTINTALDTSRDVQQTGTIPSALSACTSVNELYLDGANGTIPAELSTLTSLTYLSVTYGFYNGGLTGTVPAWLSTLTSLEFLNLGQNSLTGTVPAELSVMTSLRLLTLYYNSLTGMIPAEWSTMTSLESLQLNENGFTGLVPSYLCDRGVDYEEYYYYNSKGLVSCNLLDGFSGFNLTEEVQNQFWCTSVCDDGSYPCDLTSERCVPAPMAVPTPASTTAVPLAAPTFAPIPAPTAVPLAAPTFAPTPLPTAVSTPAPTLVTIPSPTPVEAQQCIDCGRRLTGRMLLFGYLSCC